jgi:hypothetical protein
MFDKISSKRNEKIKFIDNIKKASNRKKFSTLIVEGFREISLAHSCQFIMELLFCEECFARDEFSLINFCQ